MNEISEFYFLRGFFAVFLVCGKNINNIIIICNLMSVNRNFADKTCEVSCKKSECY